MRIPIRTAASLGRGHDPVGHPCARLALLQWSPLCLCGAAISSPRGEDMPRGFAQQWAAQV